MARIYISSTYQDLKAFREAVYRALRRMRHDVMAMEDYVATDQRPLDKCLADVADCDVYVGIFAWRYGYIPPGQKKSITELEFRQAVTGGKECLVFLLDEKIDQPRASMGGVTSEDDGGERISALRDELKRDYTVSFFETPEDLAVKVSAAVSIWEKKQRVSRSVQIGGIHAGRIEAENVVDGVQMQGGDAQMAAGLVELARAIQRRGISAEEIRTGNLVSGLQYIADPTQATPAELRSEIAALQQQVQEAIAAGEISEAADAEDVRDALAKAEAELATPQPQGARVVRKLAEATDILTRSAEVAQAAGNFGLQIIKLSPIAATLWQIAQRLWGG